jgi:predicted transcriptional regulator
METCLICGKKWISQMHSHLRMKHFMTVLEYKDQYGISVQQFTIGPPKTIEEVYEREDNRRRKTTMLRDRARK